MLPAQSTQPGTEGDLVSDVGSEIKVAIDRWSTGQIGLSDALLAGGLLLGAAVAAWIVRRLTTRWTDSLEGPASTAGLLIGQLVSVAIYIFAIALALEVLGFGLGPLLVIVLVVIVVILLLRPLIQNLSSGLLLQLRGPFKPGDLVQTNEIIGVVEEVNTRTVVVATNDGTRVHIPSREVLESVLVNYSTVGRRRSAMTLRLPMGSDLTTTTARLEEAVAALEHVLDQPPPEVVVTDFEGAQLLVDVLFWHRPELWAARLARDRVGRIVVELLETSDLVLADPTLTVRTVGSAQSG